MGRARRGIERYVALIEPHQRGRWVGVGLFALFVSVVEAAGATLVYVLITLATEPQGDASLPLVGDLGARFPRLSHDQLVVGTALGLAAFFLFRAAVVLTQRYHQSRVTQLAGVDLSARLLQRYLRLPYAFHLRRNSSELIRNTNESVQEILGSVLSPAVKLVSDGLVVVGILAVLLATAPVATGLVAVVMAPLIFVAMRVVQPRMKRLGKVSQREAARSYQALQQGLHGFRDITVLGRQEFFLATYRAARARIAETRYKRAVLSELPRVSIEAVVIAFIAVVVSVSTLAGDGPQDSLAVLGLFAYAALRIMPALNSVVRSLNSIRFGRAALEDVEADFALPLPKPQPGTERLAFEHEVRLEDVTFQYESTDSPTLHAIDLVIPRGASVGIVGATGSGKSTLIDLIVGLSAPTSGRITVDGVDLRGREAAWQRNIGMVSQEVFLLDDTLRRNIALGLADSEIDDDAVREAVQLAQLSEFAATLPAGLETFVGERGVRVSGGQRQRVAIARALYSRPGVLVFDEGTSALDSVTEAALIDALARLRQDHTIITVAHRLSTVQDYGQIVYMRDGRIADVGAFDALALRNEEFRRLARLSSPITT